MRRWAILVVLMMAQAAGAESILERRYTSDKLDGFWQGTLGATAPDAAWFDILSGADSAEPVVEAPPTPAFDLPFAGVIIGESGDDGSGTQVSNAFPVIPLSPGDAAMLVRRLAWAEIYLSRYRFFEAVSTDTSDVLDTLLSRQYAAGLEAALVSARLYFSASDLQTKCRHLTRMGELNAGPLAGLDPDALPTQWQALAPIHADATQRIGDSALSQIVCSAEPVRTRAETVELIKTRVREQLMVEVRAKVEDSLQLLEGASTQFQTLVNDMDVPIASAEILELERVLGNASANMILVKEDQLRAQETIEELQGVDLSALNQPGQMAEFETGQARMAAMVALIDDVMAAMADLAAVSGDPQVTTDLAPCTDLRGAYSALDLNLDTGTLARQIEGPYEVCITQARAVVARFQQPTLDKAFMAELAREVRQLSETYLATVSP